MKRILIAATALGSLTAMACSDKSTNAPASDLAVTMASAFSAAPQGYSSLSSSFVGDEGASFSPEFGRGDDDHSRGGPFHFGGRGMGPGFGLGFMGGGVFGGFIGNGFVRSIFAGTDTSCTFASGTGLISCTPRTHDGLTTTRVFQFQTTGGTSQAKFDATTNSVTTKVSVTGTSTRRNGNSSTIDLSSSQTVAGLAAPSTGLTMNSASKGIESGKGTSAEGAFTSSRTVGDTVKGVVIPFPTGGLLLPYPTAGTIIRSMSSSVTITGQAATSSSRREVITYDGTNTAKVVITLDGATQNCTLPLPFGRLNCPTT